MQQNDALTGYEHLVWQQVRIMRAFKWMLLVLVPAWIWLWVSDNQALSRTVMIGTFALIPTFAWIFRPRCPFCKRTLALTWKGLSVGNYCSECGAAYSSEVTTNETTEPADGSESLRTIPNS